jgi:hypothetical protein
MLAAPLLLSACATTDPELTMNIDSVQAMQPGDVQLSCDQLKTEVDKTTNTLRILDKQLANTKQETQQGLMLSSVGGSAAATGAAAASMAEQQTASETTLRDNYQKRHDFLMSQYYAKRCGGGPQTAQAAAGTGASPTAPNSQPAPTQASNAVAPKAGPSGLPVAVEADLLANKIIAAVKANDPKAEFAAIDEYEQLKVTMPPPLLFEEAKLSYRTRDYDRALQALQAFLKVATRGSAEYNQAVGLYGKSEQADKASPPSLEATWELIHNNVSVGNPSSTTQYDVSLNGDILTVVARLKIGRTTTDRVDLLKVDNVRVGTGVVLKFDESGNAHTEPGVESIFVDIDCQRCEKQQVGFACASPVDTAKALRHLIRLLTP